MLSKRKKMLVMYKIYLVGKLAPVKLESKQQVIWLAARAKTGVSLRIVFPHTCNTVKNKIL